MALRPPRTPVDADGYLHINGSDALLAGEFGFRLSLEAGFRLVPLRSFEQPADRTPAQSKRVRSLVGSASSAAISAAAGLGRGFVVGASLPIEHVVGPNVVVPGDFNDRAGQAPSKLAYTGLGDLELAGKYSLLEATANGLGTGAALRLSLPTGNSAHFAGTPGFGIWPTWLVEYAFLPALRVGAEAGYRFVSGHGAELPVGSSIPAVSSAADAAPNLRYTAGCDDAVAQATCVGAPIGGRRLRYDDLVTFGAAIRFKPTERIGVFLEWSGSAILRSLTVRDALAGELALGGRYQITSAVSATLAGSLGAPRGMLGSSAGAFVYLTLAPSDSDLDGDGMAARSDACADSAEDFDGFEDSDGCPEPDNDRDGSPDAVDQCPDDPGNAADAGCPVRGIADRDHDGVNDYLDACPNDPGTVTDHGCPAPRAPDSGASP